MQKPGLHLTNDLYLLNLRYQRKKKVKLRHCTKNNAKVQQIILNCILMTEITNVNDQINNSLIEWQICCRCRIRLMNKNIDFEKFREVEEEESWICYVCCGILQKNLINDETINKIKSDIFNSEFKYNSFQVVVSTPINLFIREYAVCTALKEKYPKECENLSLDDIVHIKSIWRYLIKDYLSRSLEKSYINGNQVQIARCSQDCLLENDFLIVNITFNHLKDSTECNVLSDLDPVLFQRRRKGGSRYKWELFTRKGAEKVLKDTSKEKFRRYFSLPPNHNLSSDLASIEIEVCRQDPVIVAGRYSKFSRRLPQSPWVFDGVRKLDSSVEELISEKLVAAFKAASSGFISSGREDVDVRMLGKGRPFVIELRNCKNMVRDLIDDTDKLEREINEFSDGRVAVNSLKIISKEFVSLIKQGEEEKSKQYRMVVWCENGISDDESELTNINEARDVLVQQLTPIRVLHRRSLIKRPRTFYSFTACRLDRALSDEALSKDESLRDYSRFLDNYDTNHLFLLNLRCQAGSYVKEFVHGDLGRTQPNLGVIIGQQCDILALDVVEIELDWPPTSSDKSL